jgi:MFS family permease
MLTVSSGLGFYNHAVILKALTSNLNFPITASSIAISVFFLSSGLAGLLVSLLLERYDARFVITTGALIAGAALGSLGLVENLSQLFILYILFGIGFSASGLLPATTLITRWFVDRRASAMSITTTGLSVGGVLVTPLSAYMIEQQGMRVTAPWLGVLFVLGIVPLCLMYVRSHPPAATDSPASSRDKAGIESLPDLPGISFRDTIRSSYFWGLSVAYLCLMLSQVGGIAHQFNLLAGHISIGQATTMLAILPASSIVGRLAGGWILDHIDMKAFTLLMIMLQVVSLLVLSLMQTQWALGLGLVLFGISVGNVLMLHPLLVAEGFGLKHYSRTFAFSNLMATMGVAAGPGLMGWLYSLSGNYTGPYLMATLVTLVALLIFWLARER